jgi:hypothetical protein
MAALAIALGRLQRKLQLLINFSAWQRQIIEPGPWDGPAIE